MVFHKGLYYINYSQKAKTAAKRPYEILCTILIMFVQERRIQFERGQEEGFLCNQGNWQSVSKLAKPDLIIS